MSPIVLTITPSFPIRFPSFRSHSRRLRRLSIAGRIACRQHSSRVSYKSFSAVTGPVRPKRLIRQLSFPRFQSRSAPPPANPQLLVSRSHIAGTQRINTAALFLLCKVPCSCFVSPKLSQRSWLGFGLVEGSILFRCSLIGRAPFEHAPAPVPWRETFGRRRVSAQFS